ncbi:membrane protease YdiL (CAAX protease family) [Natronobacillus azotifigens]|uniref:CPBP family intramembrane metalloprotease n=1 Tax=Natronobacillus azotifigens TaxID=472978 RepID=A0A9J6R884_9BACI|nr:CPBP family intramembrane glutamic endopeptidase [Natronobacillus azotifigens]MCZ0701837.1 CPBP family intramembrane metalloprotease [Natronobacillus azotifigens]
MIDKQQVWIEQMTSKQIRLHVYATQGLLLLLSILLLLLFSSPTEHFIDLFDWSSGEILYLGVVPSFSLVVLEIVLYRVIPSSHWDDGGVNQIVFRDISMRELIGLTLMIAFCEELLFRGVLQPLIGYIGASLLFACIHFRYVKKPFLLMIIIMLSFGLGFMFEHTGNLLVSITAHFVINFCLGSYIRYTDGGINHD